jgi:hypothetical protein
LADDSLVDLAREGLGTPLPAAWKPCKTTDTFELYYFNFRTGESTWQHPVDEMFRDMYRKAVHRKPSTESISIDPAEVFEEGWVEALRAVVETQYDLDRDGRLGSTEIRRLIVALGNDAAAVNDAIQYLAQETSCHTLHVGDAGYITVDEVMSFFQKAAAVAPQAVVENLHQLELQRFVKVGGKKGNMAAGPGAAPAPAVAAALSPPSRAPPNMHSKCPHKGCSKWLVLGERMCKEHAAKEEQLQQLHPWR